MAWIGRILFFIVVLLVVNLARSLLSRLFNPHLPSGGRARTRPAQGTISGQTVKDPHCGMYVATDLAVRATIDGKTLHFCSEECRNLFLRQREAGKLT